MIVETSPTFSFITAVYESAPYLPAYLDAMAGLSGGHDDLEIVFVDDGSSDDSVAIIERWIDATGAPARLLRKEHGGSISARNLGLDAARGTWVSFPDPDDVVDRDYLSSIRRFLGEVATTDVAVLAARVLQFRGTPDEATDDHVLGFRYQHGATCVHLHEDPRYFHTHAPSGFYRRAVIERAGLRLDPRLAAAFEDAGFVAEYLLQFDDPVVGVVPDAVYRYRRRADSVLGTMWTKDDRYTAVPEHGYLRLLRQRATAPTWLQLLVLYDLIWYFYEYDQPGTPNRSVDASIAARFLEQLDRVLALIDGQHLYAYCLHPLSLRIRSALFARKTGRLPAREARVEADGAGSAVVTYFRLPNQLGAEVITVDGRVRQALETTDRPVEYYGEVFLVERSLRIDAPGTLMVLVDGEAVSLSANPDGTGAWFRRDRQPTLVPPSPAPRASGEARPDTPLPRWWRRGRR